MEWNWNKNITKEKLIDLYVKQKLGMRKVAKILNVDRLTIRRHLKRHDIPIDASIRKTLNTSKLIPTSKQTSLIYGTMMGDSCIYKEKRCKSTRLSFSHCKEQIDYIIWKRKQFGKLMASKKIKIYNNKGTKGTNIPSATYSCHFFRDLRNVFYNKNNKKHVTEEILKKIDGFALAIWFMDDGCHKKLGLELATCCYTYNEHELMKKWFIKKYNVRPIIRKSGNKQFVLFFNKVNSIKLINIIKPYIIPSMKYKINLSIDPQRLHEGLIHENKKIQSELTRDSKSIAEMTMPYAIA